MLSLTYIGHAGWLCEGNNFKCVFDPWSSSYGSFLNQWYPFPGNGNVNFKEVLSDLDFLYISHAHNDHLNFETLQSVDKSTSVLIPKFKDKTLLNELKSFGFKNIQQLDLEDEICIKNVKIKVFKDEGYIDSDSAILLDDGQNKVLNLNDCHIDFVKIKELAGDVDLLLLQASSALWWPCVYNYDQKTMESHGELKRNNTLHRAYKYAKVLNSKMTIPNAGPPVFRDKKLEKWNFNRRESWNPFCLVDEASDYLNKRGAKANFLLPMDTVNLESTISFNINESLRREVYENVNSYTEKYLKNINQKPISIVEPAEEEQRQAVDKFLKQIKVISKISKFYTKKIDFPILFNFKDFGSWVVNFRKEEVVEKYKKQICNYSFEMEPKAVALIFRRKNLDFEHYFLGCDFRCSRNPDVYNEFLFTILRHFDSKRLLISESLYAERKNIQDELFVLNHNGNKYEVQKYCPHMFADLEECGYVDENDNLVCPLHGWKFNLQTGVCVNKKNYCLKVKKE